ncbi:MAG: phosphoribosylamine--glycine ligase [Calditrichae bacterium]|nr:phosphoribosylamine--glycine ligase [Calditrichia bacterium]NIW78114.1 phosphoribosylamine--glycine ligase [Calditrichia bacterium]
MKALVIGSGGREHAIVWRLRQNPDIQKIYCIPGNGGIQEIAECHSIPVNDFKQLAKFAEEKQIDHTVVGPEQPLVEGIVDYFRDKKLPIFGPSQSAARMEGSKIFAKNLMAKYRIPTAIFEEFHDPDTAVSYLNNLSDQPLVVKADGLAAGKGSIVCANKQIALQAVDSLMTKQIFKEAGASIVIEEKMSGDEVSFFVITDGKDYRVLTPAQDFKRAEDGDQGKNTGGMGSYAPTPFLGEDLYQTAIEDIVEPTLAALQSEGIDYRGVLYVGLMLTPDGPKVVEFNCRFGDPETQVVLPLLKTDLLQIVRAVHTQSLGKLKLKLDTQYAVCTVLASAGYPNFYEKGKEISGLKKLPQNILTFHSGTRQENGHLLTSGGRVLGITGISPILKEASSRVYAAISKIHFEGMHYRTDIAEKAWRKLGE